VTQGKTVRAEPQNAEEISAFLLALPGVLQESAGPAEWVGAYGYGCEVHPDLWYKPMFVALGRLASFLSQSSAQGIFIPGHSDMELASTDGRVVISVSHEGWVRISGTDGELVQGLAHHPALRQAQRSF
jgi:hypothetical protein